MWAPTAEAIRLSRTCSCETRAVGVTERVTMSPAQARLQQSVPRDAALFAIPKYLQLHCHPPTTPIPLVAPQGSAGRHEGPRSHHSRVPLAHASQALSDPTKWRP